MPSEHVTQAMPGSQPTRHWPAGLTRVPYWLYQDDDVRRAEQARLFQGRTWNFLCLEHEVANPGDYRTAFIGEMPVIVARAENGELVGFENRCAHRGALIAFEDGGTVQDFTCVYHAWRYDLRGNLKSVAFSRGVNGKGGMPATFCIEQHGPRKLRVESFCGLVFGTLAADAPTLADYIGDEVGARIRRVLCKPVEIIGRFTQPLPNNWKLYAENVKDTYHASLLHLFFTTFRITRFSQAGGITVSDDGAHHASATIGRLEAADSVYKDQAIRSDSDSFRLADPSMLDPVDEFNDGIQLQILTLFPTFVLQQTHNSIAVRHFVPRGVDAMDLHWIFLGFTDDTPQMRTRRLKQANLVGPAGFVSMEDGCIGNFVQRGAAAAAEQTSIVEMGGATAESQATRATEAAVRGFWQVYRAHLGI